jgi:hypothetical protein
MKKASLPALLVFCLSINSYSKTENTDTLTNTHLIVKTDILFPIGLMVEYKTKPATSFQLSGHYSMRPFRKYDYYDFQTQGSYEVLADVRHYFNNHFVGIYIKYAHFEDNVSIYAPFKQVYFSFGLMYGYQKEWGRFNLEGLIGFGISATIEHEGSTKIGLYYFDGKDYYSPFIDARLSICVGYRIF